MHRPRGLGRGLGALFAASSPPIDAGAEQTISPLAQIEVDTISPNPLQPRRHFDEQALHALARSIETHGLLAPILVRRDPQAPDRYQIITGERRWRAARIAGLRSVPAIVRPAQAGEAVELAVLENVQRADLNPIEEASGYSHLIDEHGYTQEALAERLGKSRPAVANALRLLTLPDSVQALVRDGRLSAGHARALAALPSVRANELAHEVVRHGWSVRELERRTVAPNARSHAAFARRTLPADVAEAENRLRFALATKVQVQHGPGGGTIRIHYANDDELTRIVERVTGR